MRPLLALAAVVVVAVVAWPLVPRGPQAVAGLEIEMPRDTIPGPVEPSAWFFRQRAFPEGTIDQVAFVEAQAQARAMRQAARAAGAPAWAFAGPTNIGGRVTSLAVQDFQTFYAGTGSGGLFKTTDGGATFAPVADDAFSLAIGDVTLDPRNPQTVWVGTGEANGGGGSLAYGGSGVWRSTDGGATWQPRGLDATSTIGRVLVHPTDSDRVWVAATGSQFTNGPDRGLYRTTDGGATWTRTLFVNDSTGVVDVAVNPRSPDSLYAATWTRRRTPSDRSYGGPGSGLWRSADGGVTWARVPGLPADADVGRIGVAVAPSRPNVVYAVMADASGDTRGMYRSEDGGSTWATLPIAQSVAFGWWFGQVRVDPTDWRRVYVPWLNLYGSSNAGQAWTNLLGSMHVDQHALWIDPANPQRLIAGNDGGVYRSTNAGLSWAKAAGGFPATQFYTAEIDAQQPARLYGGTQDNGTVRTLSGGTADWAEILGGDGHYVRVDPSDNRYVYAEYQYGAFFRSTDGGASFLSARPGAGDRANWSAPVVLDPAAPATLYFGTHRVWRSANRAASWTAVSPDLTGGPGTGTLVYGTVTTIDVSPVRDTRLWAGTDDGRVWTTEDGTTWTNVTGPLPTRWVTRVTAHPTNALSAVVTLSGYRWGEAAAHVFRTDDGGATWTAIESGLPDAPANDILFDPTDPDRLFLATDVGTFWSADGGASWAALGAELPLAPVTDLVLHDRTLVAATYGRGLFRLDLRELGTAAAAPPQAPALPLTASPNPTRGPLTLRTTLAAPADVRAEVLDARGRVVLRTRAARPAGDVTLTLDLGRLAAGAYTVRLTAGERVATRRVSVAR